MPSTSAPTRCVAGAAGWRLGTFTFPASLHWLADAMASTASETFTSTSAPIQYAAVRGFEGGQDIEDYLAQSRRSLGQLARRCANRLRGAGAVIGRPVGAFYLFPDFSPFRESLRERGITSSVDLCEHLLQDAGVAILSGSDFGRPEHELTVRLALVDFDGAEALRAAAEVPRTQPLPDGFAATYCEAVVTAVDWIYDWLQVSN